MTLKRLAISQKHIAISSYAEKHFSNGKGSMKLMVSKHWLTIK